MKKQGNSQGGAQGTPSRPVGVFWFQRLHLQPQGLGDPRMTPFSKSSLLPYHYKFQHVNWGVWGEFVYPSLHLPYRVAGNRPGPTLSPQTLPTSPYHFSVFSGGSPSSAQDHSKPYRDMEAARLCSLWNPKT